MRLVYYALLFLDALQLGTAALYGLEELAEVVFEVGEDLIRVIFRATVAVNALPPQCGE